MAISAMLPLVIHIFAPLMIQSSPSRRARVFMLDGSEPPCDSVSPKQPMTSPAAILGNQRCFCSSEPKARSEERRVGKECRSQRSRFPCSKKDEWSWDDECA